MSTLLYIKANPKTDAESATFKVSERFIEEYKSKNPEHTIITLDLYKEGVEPLSRADIQYLFSPNIEKSRAHHIVRYAYQFAEADKYVFAAPIWNLSIPSILKAYIDYIAIAGITFKYTEEGSIGLCCDKKAIHITARGGLYSQPPLSEIEMGDRYLRKILNFMGIQDIQTLTIEGLNIITLDHDAIIEDGIQRAIESAKRF
ncbi:MAG: FMN-dependent NADH-azoreductase [Clostridiales bacterium]|nr:FMN-dependent NADH-azoreductase [Clostridiales bacterium]